jgi:hypothetical protein
MQAGFVRSYEKFVFLALKKLRAFFGWGRMGGRYFFNLHG